MSSLYEKIEQGAKHGLYSLIQPEHGYFYLVTPFKDNNGYYSESVRANTFEGALSQIGYLSGKSWQDWNDVEKKQKFIRYVSHAEIVKPEPYKVGDLVDVLEIGKRKHKKEIGKSEVRMVNDDFHGLNYLVYEKEEDRVFAVRHEWLAPHIPEDGTMNLSEEEQEMIQTLRDKGFKITKE